MSTSATIETEWAATTYHASADGYPRSMEPYIEDIIETAREIAQEEYKEPEDKWQRECKRLLDEKTEGNYSELSKTVRGRGNYHYVIGRDGEVTVKD